MTPGLSEPGIEEDDDVVSVPCYEIGNTNPELPEEVPGDPFQGGSRRTRSGRLSLAAFVRIPIIEKEATSNRFVAKGKWSPLAIDVSNGQWGEVRANGWEIAVRRFHQLKLDQIILPQLQPTTVLNYVDIVAPIMIGLPETRPDGASYEIKHYWLMTSNSEVRSGRATALLITKEWLVVASRPILSEVSA
jgi:hypothetical protein